MSAAGDRVARAIVADIADARVRPGDPLPGAPELARRFAVGAGAVAGALRDLEARGMVAAQPDGRVTVRPEAQ